MDKSNVLENSQLWRKVVVEVATEYPDVELDHMLVDNCAMQLVLNPQALRRRADREHVRRHPERRRRGAGRLDRHAAVGVHRRPRASGAWVGLYEPVHGSAPDIAGQNKANPLGAIGSVAAMLEYSFGLKEEAAAVETAIEAVLDSGQVTADLRPTGTPATTEQVGKRSAPPSAERGAYQSRARLDPCAVRALRHARS